MRAKYVEAAMRCIEIRRNVEECSEFPDQRFIGSIPPCKGVIGIGETEETCRQDTREALEGWIDSPLDFSDPLPVIDGIDIDVGKSVFA